MNADDMRTALNASRREREIDELTRRPDTDVLVVGLGVTGAGIALDAASRGLSVVAVDAHDLAFGTSRWSSKLVHGGLRYLANLDVGVARECAVERGVLLTTTAPHLVRPLPIVIPLTPAMSRTQAAVTRAGLWAGDELRRSARTPSGLLPRSRRITQAESVRLVPTLRSDGLRGALMHWDGQLTDDARLVVTLARTAAGFGARILTRVRADEISGTDAALTDTRSGHQVAVHARAVINATGVWASSLTPEIRLRPSLGTHVVLDARTLGGAATAVTIGVPGQHSRYVSVVPHADGLVFAGVTDEPVEGPIPDVPQPPEKDIAFLLDVLALALDPAPRRTDVLGAFAGLRPLLDSGDARTADISRRHAVITGRDRLISVVGGKLTTYRAMAQDAVDAAIRAGRLEAGRCRTRELPLVGAASPAALAQIDAPARLIAKYGTEASQVAGQANDGSGAMAPIAPGTQVTLAELLFAVRYECALDADDLLDRRTRVGLLTSTRAAAIPAAQTALAASQ